LLAILVFLLLFIRVFSFILEVKAKRIAIILTDPVVHTDYHLIVGFFIVVVIIDETLKSVWKGEHFLFFLLGYAVMGMDGILQVFQKQVEDFLADNMMLASPFFVCLELLELIKLCQLHFNVFNIPRKHQFK
jgi:hypothetical protein